MQFILKGREIEKPIPEPTDNPGPNYIPRYIYIYLYNPQNIHVPIIFLDIYIYL